MIRKKLTMVCIALICVLTITLGLAFPVPIAHALLSNIIYVRAGADLTGDTDGRSWEHAFPELQPALDLAEAGANDGFYVEIWVAAGIYYPEPEQSIDTRLASFSMLNNVAIYGGFPAGGGTWTQRNWEVNETILSGNIGDPELASDNCYHVINNFNLNATAILDGFIITAGYADHANGPHNGGGGVYGYSASPTFRNVKITENYAGSMGGGMYNDWQCDPVLENVTFEANSAAYGGGMVNSYSSPVLTGVSFISNSVSGGYGGGIYNSNSSPTLDCVTIRGNTSDWRGGGMYSEDSIVYVTNSLFEENTASDGGGIYNSDSSTYLTGVAFVRNSALTESEDMGDGGAVYTECSGITPQNTSTGASIQTTENGFVDQYTDVSFEWNSADRDGGAIYCAGDSLAVKDASFVSNSAYENGGAIFSDNGLSIMDTEFEHNCAGADGGAIYARKGYMGPNELLDVYFVGNTAGEDGGAVNADLMSLGNGAFCGNRAGENGGGVFLRGSSLLFNATFAANIAEENGGGIASYLYDATVNSEEATKTVGLTQEESGSILANLILWGNSALEDGQQIHNSGTPPQISSSLIQGSGGSSVWESSVGYDAGNNIDADPRFVRNPVIDPIPANWPNNDYGDLRLRSNSPARDAGANEMVEYFGIEEDILEQARIVRDIVDMGAYEYQVAPPPPAPVGPILERLGGQDRFETAVEVSKAGWISADTVFLARSDDFADSLAGVPLAYSEDAPILLTKPEALPQVTKAEIQRLGADRVVILGGKDAVSPAVEQELKNMGLTVERVGGLNRFATAAAIAALVAPDGCAEVALANGYVFADALSVATYAARSGMPILLTNTGAVPAETSGAITGLNAGTVLVVGGTSVITAGSLADVDDYLRIAGADRYATAIALAEHFTPATDRIFVATGLKFPDCLTGAVLAAKEGCGMILLNGDIPAVVENYLAGKIVLRYTVLGGTAAVSEDLANQLIK